jgi:hypothetical protein
MRRIKVIAKKEGKENLFKGKRVTNRVQVQIQRVMSVRVAKVQLKRDF